MPAYKAFQHDVSPALERRAQRRTAGERGRRSRERLGKPYNTATAPATGVRIDARPAARARHAGMPASKLGAIAVALLLVAGLIYAFVGPDWFVWDAEILGARWLTDEEVFQTAGIGDMSIFFVEPGRIVQSLERLPTVERARVICRLPNRVQIYLVERRPAAIWQNQGIQYWTDHSGHLFPRAADMEDQVVIVEQDNVGRQAGDVIDKTAVATSLGIHRLLPDVRIFGYSGAEGISFDLSTGQRVLVPAGADVRRSVAALSAMQEHLKGTGTEASIIDLRYETRAFWR